MRLVAASNVMRKSSEDLTSLVQDAFCGLEQRTLMSSIVNFNILPYRLTQRKTIYAHNTHVNTHTSTHAHIFNNVQLRVS